MPSTFLDLSCYYWKAIPVKRCRVAVYPGHPKFGSNHTHIYMHSIHLYALHTHIRRPYNIHAIQLFVTFEDMHSTQHQYLIQYNLTTHITHTQLYMPPYMHAHIHIVANRNRGIHTQKNMYTYTDHIYTYIYIHTHIYTYIYTFIDIHIHITCTIFTYTGIAVC